MTDTTQQAYPWPSLSEVRSEVPWLDESAHTADPLPEPVVDIAVLQQNAYEEGLQKGIAAGEASVAQALAALTSAADALTAHNAELTQQVLNAFVELLPELFMSVFQVESQINPAVLNATIEHILKQVPTTDALRIKVSQEDFEHLKGDTHDLIVADHALVSGQFSVESKLGLHHLDLKEQFRTTLKQVVQHGS